MSVIDLDTLNLAHGSHSDRTNGLCLLEAVAWFADEPHSAITLYHTMITCEAQS